MHSALCFDYITVAYSALVSDTYIAPYLYLTHFIPFQKILLREKYLGKDLKKFRVWELNPGPQPRAKEKHAIQ